jgi:uncharacterized protein YgiM (DUF1202 family)
MKPMTLTTASVLVVLSLSRLTLCADAQPGAAPVADASETAPATDLSSAELRPGPAAVVGNNVNVRAQATINSEVVTQLQDGNEVTVEEIILRTNTKGQDPARWAQITYPTNATAWVHSSFIEAANQTVKPRKLNVRSGPGESYTIVATLSAGDAVELVGSRDQWLSIRPPTGAKAFVAAKLLRQVLETTVVTSAPPVTESVTSTQPEMVDAATTAPQGEATSSTWDPATHTQRTDVVTFTPLPEAEAATLVETEQPPVPRVVQREGIVRSFTSIQAPSPYKLVSADNGRNINYLHTTTTNLDLSRYLGLHIIATGEESLDERWPNMPVLTLKRIIVLE